MNHKNNIYTLSAISDKTEAYFTLENNLKNKK